MDIGERNADRQDLHQRLRVYKGCQSCLVFFSEESARRTMERRRESGRRYALHQGPPWGSVWIYVFSFYVVAT
jgi:hypothetical protein